MTTSSDDALAEQLLALIRTKPEQPLPADDLCRKLEVDREALDKSLLLLADWDYKIKKRRDSVAFVSAPDLLTEIEIACGLTTKQFGRRCHCYKAVKSTNDTAAQLAEQKAEHGTVVTAEEQLKGRGRLGRTWYSPPGTGIYVSVILRPNFVPDKAPAISIVAAIALADTFAKWVAADVQIKWPNDVWIGGRKVAGILTELSADRKKVHHIVVGIGINVNHTRGQIPEELSQIATSLRQAVRKPVRRIEVLQLFLKNFEREFRLYEEHGLSKSHGKVRRYSALIGQPVAVRIGRKIIEGTAEDIDTDGRLILRTAAGVVPVTAGEVTVVKR
jgi:BirA family biotin operon repressor/biotin-[acetyl-CoA-carboxylase] ligase